MRKADELCKRVLTTSNGHVTIAPTVPATLEINSQKQKLCYFQVTTKCLNHDKSLFTINKFITIFKYIVKIQLMMTISVNFL